MVTLAFPRWHTPVKVLLQQLSILRYLLRRALHHMLLTSRLFTSR